MAITSALVASTTSLCILTIQVNKLTVLGNIVVNYVKFYHPPTGEVRKEVYTKVAKLAFIPFVGMMRAFEGSVLVMKYLALPIKNLEELEKRLKKEPYIMLSLNEEEDVYWAWSWEGLCYAIYQGDLQGPSEYIVYRRVVPQYSYNGREGKRC